MRHRSGQNRQQFGLPFRMTIATPLDDMIAPDNMVSVIDAFVDAIDLEKAGLVRVRAHRRGAPPYQPANMRRGVSILGVSDLLKRVKALFFPFFALTACVERLSPDRRRIFRPACGDTPGRRG